MSVTALWKPDFVEHGVLDICYSVTGTPRRRGRCGNGKTSTRQNVKRAGCRGGRTLGGCRAASRVIGFSPSVIRLQSLLGTWADPFSTGSARGAGAEVLHRYNLARDRCRWGMERPAAWATFLSEPRPCAIDSATASTDMLGRLGRVYCGHAGLDSEGFRSRMTDRDLVSGKCPFTGGRRSVSFRRKYR